MRQASWLGRYPGVHKTCSTGVRPPMHLFISYCARFMCRFGRAMLRPLFQQQHGRHSTVSQSLRLALNWWLEVLTLSISECKEWQPAQQSVVHMYADARSSPPRLGVVVLVDGQYYYCDAAPSPSVLQQFAKRDDGQITSLEILAIALGAQFCYPCHVPQLSWLVCGVYVSGISTFGWALRGRRLLIFSDNKGAEHATQKGRPYVCSALLFGHERL